MIHQIEFWIAIVFWCVGQTCGMATHTISFVERAECVKEITVMEQGIRANKSLNANIIESRCSPQKISVRVLPQSPEFPEFRRREPGV